MHAAWAEALYASGGPSFKPSVPCRMGYPPPPAMMGYAQQQQQQQAAQQAQHQPQQPPPHYARPVVKPAVRRAIKIGDPATLKPIQLGPATGGRPLPKPPYTAAPAAATLHACPAA